MQKIVIFITTYNRPELLKQLIKDIIRERNGYILDLIIINDHSTLDYSQVINQLNDHFPDNHRYIVNPENYGKAYYWKTVSRGYNLLLGETFDYFIQLPDDVRLIKGFFKRATDSFDAIHDSQKTCMNILVEYSRLMKPCWTDVMPKPISFNGIDLIRTGWVDMCFISNVSFFKALNFTINAVDLKWSTKKGVSSGVGMQISRRIIAQNKSIYSVKRSLVMHGDHRSVMHPEHRQAVPLITNHDMSRIIATMATFPGRERCLQEAVESLIDQVDELHIYANNLHKKQINLHHKKLKWHFSNDHLGDLGDAGKFYQVEKINGYHFTVDDDIIYPADYVAEMVNAIEKYDRKAVISLHGRIMPPEKVQSYYKNHARQFSCLRAVQADIRAHIVGTGVLAYHTDTLNIPFEIFQAANMADIWFSKYCNEKGIPRVIIQHRGGWIRESVSLDQTGTIYSNNVNDCSFQTKIVNSVPWNLS